MVARMKGGLGIGRCLGSVSGGERVRILVRRNREVQMPLDRVLLTTGITAATEAEVQELWTSLQRLASEIDLSDVWDVVRAEGTSMSLEDLAEIYWGPSYDASQRAALLLHLEGSSQYFVNDGEAYTPQTQEYVRDLQARRQRKAEQALEAATLVEHLSRGMLPPQTTRYQSGLVDHLKGFAIHGDNYTRSSVARGLVGQLESGTRDLERLSFDLLVRTGIFSPDEPLELERAGIRREFAEAALEEASAIDVVEAISQPHRRDLTALPTVTIDDDGTEDRDDALSLEVEGPGTTYLLGIHVTDVGALVVPQGALDQEADRRMATIYLPELNVPMLAPGVSGGAGSLVADESRPALSLLVKMNESAEVLCWEVVPSVIRSQEALSYDSANRAIADRDLRWHQMLDPLSRVAVALKKRREKAGAISLERPEMLIKVAASGEVTVRVVPHSTPARTMVAELMILCNSLLAEFCRSHRVPAVYRAQVAPDLGDVPVEIREGPLKWHLFMRRLLPSDLDIVPAAHASLGVPAYIQATSPLRRYPDLVMQRQISRFLTSGQLLYAVKDVASVAQRAEVQMKELSRIEGDRRRYWFLKYLKQDRLEREKDEAACQFQAVVLENHPRRQALMELVEYPFRTRADLADEFAPGDTVVLRLHGVDLWRRTAQFVHDRARG